VTRGAQWEWFSEEARVVLFAGPYAASEDCSRMGLRLRGSALPARRQGVMLTEGVSLGSLQVPGDGQPIISFVEHQTTGGYPQIACVIAADLHRVGQLRPRDQVRFEEVSFEEADDALRQQEAMLLQYLETAQ
jgi:allophanate hydrolase subunit 2